MIFMLFIGEDKSGVVVTDGGDAEDDDEDMCFDCDGMDRVKYAEDRVIRIDRYYSLYRDKC